MARSVHSVVECRPAGRASVIVRGEARVGRVFRDVGIAGPWWSNIRPVWLGFWWTGQSEEACLFEEASDSSAVGHAVDVDCEAGFHVDVTSRYLSGGAVTDVDSCCAGVIFDQGVVPVVVFAVSEKCLFRLFQVEAGCEAIAVLGEAFSELVGFLDIAADHEGTVGGKGGLPAVFGGTAQGCGRAALMASALATCPAAAVEGWCRRLLLGCPRLCRWLWDAEG